jgi:HK97 family phage portal protein
MSRLSDAWAAFTGKASRQPASGGAMLSKLRPWGEPPRRGTQQLIASFRTHPWMRAVAGRISRELASVPWSLTRIGGKGEPVTSHPFLSLVARPNPSMNGRQFVELTQVWLDTKGEAFWIKERNHRGQVVQLWPVPPHWITETATPERPFFRGSFGAWQPSIPADDVVWLRELDPENPYGRGAGIGEALSDELDTDEFAAKHTKSFFFNKATPEAIVSVEEAPAEELRRIEEDFNAKHRGFWNSFRSFFTSSKVTVQRLDTTFKDMELSQLRKDLRDTFIAVYGVPPEVVGVLANSNRATIESAYFLLAKGVLVPRLRAWADVWNDLLLTEFDETELAYEFDSPIPEDREYLLKAVQTRPTAFTDNEIRASAGLPPAKGKDEFPEPAPAFPMFGGDPEWTRALPPARRRNLAPDDISRVLAALDPSRLTAETDPVFREKTREWTQTALNDLGAADKFNAVAPTVDEFLREQSATRIKGLVDETTRQALRLELETGVALGESIRDISARVRSVFTQATEARAEMIARTEVIRASNWAATEAQKVAGIARRAWVATRDGRAREEHLALDGVEVPIDEPFKAGGASAMYPGDFGIASLDVGCRCTVAAVLDDPDKAFTPDELDAVWRRFDSGIRPWEADAERALRRGFRSQEGDVLRALEDRP